MNADLFQTIDGTTNTELHFGSSLTQEQFWNRAKELFQFTGEPNVISLQPAYVNATYFSSGSTAVGQLTNGYDGASNETFYRWTSTEAAVNDNWIAIRVRVSEYFLVVDPRASHHVPLPDWQYIGRCQLP